MIQKTPITPVEVEVKFKFLVSTEEDKDYLTNFTNPEMSILSDVFELFSSIDLICFEVEGVKVPKD